MQEVRLPNRRAPAICSGLAAAGGAAAVVGELVDLGLVTFAGVGGGVFLGFLGFGCWIVSKKQRQGIAAMRAGRVLGSWGGEGRPRVDVGETLAVVDGEPRLFHVGFRRATGVELDPGAGRLTLRGISSDGNAEVAFAFELPVGASDLDLARACGRRMAHQHGVSFTEAS
jgi:hypothetical protein